MRQLCWRIYFGIPFFMFPPRFLLVLSVQPNLLRALLITRQLKTVAFARQTFQGSEPENGIQTFDPAEIWYKMKKVIAACLDIGRTLSREIAGIVIVDEAISRIVWHQEGDEIVSRGYLSPSPVVALPDASERTSELESDVSGTLATWLLWNLTGQFEPGASGEFPHTRARAPLDAELPVIAAVDYHGTEISSGAKTGDVEDAVLFQAAESAWASWDRQKAT